MPVDREYRFIFNENASRDFAKASEAVDRGAKHVNREAHPHAKKWRVGIEGQNAGYGRTFADAKKRATYLLRTRPIGVDIRIEALGAKGKELGQVRFRATKAQADPKSTPGNVYLDRVEGFIEHDFRGSRWAGDCVCKPDSDHARCCAVDYFDSAANMVKMRDHLLRNAEWFGIKYVILFNRIWFADGSSRFYTGTYHSHIHVSVVGTGPSAC